MTTTRKVATKPKSPVKTSAINPATVSGSDDTDLSAEAEKTEPAYVVRRKELVERIAEKSGMKPNLIKSVLDAVMLEIGDALSGGESIRVQPLGQLSVKRRKELPNGEVLVCKLRRRSQSEAPEIKAAE